jgi:hypothetical protein
VWLAKFSEKKNIEFLKKGRNTMKWAILVLLLLAPSVEAQYRTYPPVRVHNPYQRLFNQYRLEWANQQYWFSLYQQQLAWQQQMMQMYPWTQYYYTNPTYYYPSYPIYVPPQFNRPYGY